MCSQIIDQMPSLPLSVAASQQLPAVQCDACGREGPGASPELIGTLCRATTPGGVACRGTLREGPLPEAELPVRARCSGCCAVVHRGFAMMLAGSACEECGGVYQLVRRAPQAEGQAPT